MFALFFAGACVWRRRFKALVIGGIAAGGVAGLVRMSQGAHFFSDVVFSGVFMAMTVIAVHWLFETIAQQARLQNQLPADGPNFDVSFDLHRGPAE
jgi:lipid A 4'-phosphatase